ncbi:lipid-A-disaccharide synthase [Helicobacter bilis]|uniref:lipid-A-disaccharide synthase n=1 Tax=Helicobacter bilis TaxID=37372 RepID=UPI0026F34B62|nr:lipid-A-disaccharide synthase [Helicobacter bilis]MCI7411499.1 lipid-A-disaccharide synthase [Helicobacter bilis]MDD7296770.1 lipid-A-disaccharide synthase [Helicobacter bilis]MDY4399874.1 lipid-A-disaccharide synthase [Helicobacter bilis]
MQDITTNKDLITKSSTKELKIFVSALEPSSNLHLRNLAKVLPESCTLIGVCESEIGRQVLSPSEFAIMGFSDVAKKILFFKEAMQILSEAALTCDKILLMDSSSFHLRLAKKIREKNPNIPIMYYILPQVWAWKEWRAKEIERLFDKLACIWPFELHYYEKKARYVGHPLLDIYTESKQFYSKDSNIFVFMPGSRKSEIKKLMNDYRILAKKLLEKHENAILRLIIPEKFRDTKMMEIYGDIDMFHLVYNTQEGLSNASFAFVCAGTATLEASLMQIPFVLVYRAKWIDYFIARMFVKLNFVGLANIIYQAMLKENGKDIKKAGLGDDYLHEELLQNDCNAKNMLKAYENFNYQKYFEGTSTLRKYLKHGSKDNVAKWLLEP